jgi:phosphoglycerate kinase
MTPLKTIKDLAPAALAGKRALVRVDLNLPLANGEISNDFRLRQALPTLKFLLEAGASITAISHLSDSRGSLAPVIKRLKILLPEVLLLENLRQEPREEANDLAFAAELAAGHDLFVNDAFAVCHRAHASVVGVPKLLPSYAGLLVEQEVAELSRAFQPEHPFIFILGGAKLTTKIPLLEKFLPLADQIFLGGDLLNHLKDLPANLPREKIIIPDQVVREGASIKDVAEAALASLAPQLAAAQFILWNGPLGQFEAGFMGGTEALAKLVSTSPAYSMVGGGDTVAAIEKLGLAERFGFVSTGGGAMLDFLATGTLPGLEALRESQEKIGG